MKKLFEKIKNHEKKGMIIAFISIVAVIVILVAGLLTYLFTRPCSHVLDDGTLINKPTCTEVGKMEYVCTECGAVEYQELRMLEHDFKQVVDKKPTCGEDGEGHFTCTVCGFEKEGLVPATEKHDYEETLILEATCTSEGEIEKKCKVCGKTETKSVDMEAHTFEYTVIKEATCQTKGERISDCTVCGYKGEAEETPLGDHNYDETVTPATCVSEGYSSKRCTVCGTSEERTLPKTNHNYTQSVETYNTCTSNGAYIYTCSTCGGSYTETIYASGHSWVDATCTSAKTCSSCGETSGSALGHTTQQGNCERCGTYINSAKMYCNQSFPLTIYDYCGWSSVSAPTFEYGEYNEYSGKLYFEWTITVTRKFHEEGDNYSGHQYIGYKIYDANGVVVESGTMYTETIKVGESTYCSDFVSLVPGTYRIEFNNIG